MTGDAEKFKSYGRIKRGTIGVGRLDACSSGCLGAREKLSRQDPVRLTESARRVRPDVTARVGWTNLDVIKDEVCGDAVSMRVLGDLVTASRALGGKHLARLRIPARRKNGRTPIGMEAIGGKAGFYEGGAAIGDAPCRGNDDLRTKLSNQGGDVGDLNRVQLVSPRMALVFHCRHDPIDIKVDRRSFLIAVSVHEPVSV